MHIPLPSLSSWAPRVLAALCGIFLCAHGPFAFGAGALECAGSVVVTPGLSRSAAYEILVPRPGNLTTGPPGKSLTSNF